MNDVSPAEWRTRFRSGDIRQTAALCSGFVQANLALIPHEFADAFELFLRRNPAACPLLSRGRPGDWSMPELGVEDLRRDLPLYRIFHNGQSIKRVNHITAEWRDDLVPFAIGCSLSFEADLVAAGLSLRCYGSGVSCSAFDTKIPNYRSDPFTGNLVVSMRAIREDQVDQTIAITQAHPEAHGAPVHIGDPATIGVDLSRPIDGLGLTDILPGEVPVFWACGVTMERAITSAALPFAITHAPGHMLITNLRAGERP